MRVEIQQIWNLYIYHTPKTFEVTVTFVALFNKIISLSLSVHRKKKDYIHHNTF